jgi:signal transduction histidine kinase
LARSKNLAFKVDLGRGTGELRTLTEDELKMCLSNLVDNAIKYTALNGYGEVLLSLETDAHSVTFKVDDSGPGIPTAAREVVFEQFYRLTDGPTTQLGGTGLGLWRVREIAQKRSGSVWAEDSPKGGAGLRLRFPLKSTDPSS